MKKISIFGCGWVGKALELELRRAYETMASVASETSYRTLDVQKKFLLNEQNLYDEEFYNTDTLIIAIPPRGEYLETLTTLFSYIKDSTQLILLSSTSVYNQTQGRVTEQDTRDIETPSLMLQAERLLQRECNNAVILRLGGLMGYDRVAGKYTAGKTKAHDVFVNYIHRDDVVEVIKRCIKEEVKSEIFNVVAPLHPKQSELYRQNAKRFGWEDTCFVSDEILGKIVSSEKLVEYFSYSFFKPNPMAFWVD
ncbi:MAG: hypothetical protein K0U38_08985 [Epsilonproteobacteria bacterium]|nr:hypothetical protein [Campylobacterota bacterium]